MTSDNRTERFLQLEQAASDIVDELTQLKEEAMHYSESARSLDEVVQTIRRLSDGLGTASSELSSLSRSIREEGFSTIVDSLERIHSSLDRRYNTTKKLIIGGTTAIASLQAIMVIALIIF